MSGMMRRRNVLAVLHRLLPLPSFPLSSLTRFDIGHILFWAWYGWVDVI